MGGKIWPIMIYYLVNGLFEICKCPLFNNIKKFLSIVIINQSVVKHTIDLMDPQPDQLISFLMKKRSIKLLNY